MIMSLSWIINKTSKLRQKVGAPRQMPRAGGNRRSRRPPCVAYYTAAQYIIGKTYTCGTREGKSTLQNLLDYSAPCELDIIAHIYSTQHSQSQTIDIVNLWWTCYCLAIFSFETKWCCFWKEMAGNALFSPTKFLGINSVKKIVMEDQYLWVPAFLVRMVI